MEIIRQKLDQPGQSGPVDPSDFRLQQLRARDMLRGDLEGQELEEYVQSRIITREAFRYRFCP